MSFIYGGIQCHTICTKITCKVHFVYSEVKCHSWKINIIYREIDIDMFITDNPVLMIVALYFIYSCCPLECETDRIWDFEHRRLISHLITHRVMKATLIVVLRSCVEPNNVGNPVTMHTYILLCTFFSECRTNFNASKDLVWEISKVRNWRGNVSGTVSWG
jgi:hypothetical protein